jgi:outer membrane protein OmpA-like peptidoglycan-associated protein
MFSQDDDSHGWILGVVFGIVALVIALAVGLGIYQTNLKAKAAAVVATPAASAAPAASTSAADAASVKVDNGVVKFYFASGKSDVAAGGNEALADVVKAVAGGKKAVVSGFHDATGDLAKNEELSKVRAFAVRDALKALGVAEDKIELKKPENMLATGSNAEARRVEVSIQ